MLNWNALLITSRGIHLGNNKLHKLTHLHGIELFEANETRETYSRHAHSEFAIGSILQGIGGYWCRGTHYVLPRHSLTLMNPFEAHTGYAVNGFLKYKMLYVPEDAVSRLLDVGSLRGFTEINPTDWGQETGLELLELANLLNQRAGSIPAIAMRTEEVLNNLLTRVFQCYGRQELRRPGREPQAVLRIAERINAHVDAGNSEDLTIADLAGEVGLNPNYMIQSFTKARGISPYAYLLNRKICRSKEMIASGMRPLDVALELGFYDQSHFIRVFQKVLGITPTALLIH